MSEYDPAQVAIRPAATVMLVDDRPDLEVLMMQRSTDTVFASGMWVFPGGSVDDDDDSMAFQAVALHRSDQEASRLMGFDSGGLSYYVAAVRESFEEAGILLALDRQSGNKVDLTDPETAQRFGEYRDRVNDGEMDFLDLVTREDLLLDVAEMHYVARWITPQGPPRRFDARFFVARMPPGQIPLHDNRETVHSQWLAPATILERHQTKEIGLMPPTLRMVQSLAKFDSADHVIESAMRPRSDERARVIRSTREVVLPGEPGYEEASEDIESGWIRLRP